MSHSDEEQHNEAILKKIYATAHAFIMQKDYSSAILSFSYLTQTCPSEKKYWLSLATAQFHFKDFKSALESYYQLNRIDPIDPHSFYYASFCYLNLKNYKKAISCLEQVLAIVKDLPLYQVIEQKAQLLLEDLRSGYGKQKS